MKYIDKSIANEPDTLKNYRKITPNASYKGFSDKDQKLKKSLLSEQNGICAYCMQRINLKLNKFHKPQIEVEHLKSQEKHPNLSLNYENMIGVCNGNSRGIEHCDKSKKSMELKKLFPTHKNCESLITYSRSGEIKSNSNNQEVTHDINILLNLNNQRLVEYRKNTIDLIIEHLTLKYPRKTWTKKILQKEIDKYREKNKNGNYWEFRNFIVWFLSDLKKKNKYK